MDLLKRCGSCNLYTLNATCPKCNAACENPHPPKYSTPDKYAIYRRKAKYA